MARWTLTQADRDFITRDIEPFLPDRIFDAHAHLFCHAHFDRLPATYVDGPARLDLNTYYELIDWIHPGSRITQWRRITSAHGKRR